MPAPKPVAVVIGPATTDVDAGVHVNVYPAPEPPEAVAEITPFDILQPVGLVEVKTMFKEGFEEMLNVAGVRVHPF